MMIDEHKLNHRDARLREQKEIKVKIPLDYHVRLHTTKVVEGQSISETVQIALANYFAAIGTDPVPVTRGSGVGTRAPDAMPTLNAR